MILYYIILIKKRLSIHLELSVSLKSIWIFTITTIIGSDTRFYIPFTRNYHINDHLTN